MSDRGKQTKVTTASQSSVEKREARKLKTHLRDLTAAVTVFLSDFDAEMSSKGIPHETGKRIAALANALDYANDQARYFGLGVSFRTARKGSPQGPRG